MGYDMSCCSKQICWNLTHSWFSDLSHRYDVIWATKLTLGCCHRNVSKMKPSKWKILETWNNYTSEIYFFFCVCVYYYLSFYVSMFEYGNSVHQKWVQQVNKNQDSEIWGEIHPPGKKDEWKKYKQKQWNHGEWTPNPDRFVQVFT